MKNNLNLCCLLVVALLALTQCATAPQMAVSPELTQTTTAQPVKGRQGWMLNQHLAFGAYRSDRVRRGWTKSYDLRFAVRFQKASQKMEFDFNGPNGQRSAVYCFAKAKAEDLPLLNDFFGLRLDQEDVFSGSIAIGAEQWDFVVTNPNNLRWQDRSTGFVRHGDDEIRLREVRRFEKHPGNLPVGIVGYELVQNNQVLGAVETINKGRVWINPDLPADRQFVLANIAAALLLRADLSEQMDD